MEISHTLANFHETHYRGMTGRGPDDGAPKPDVHDLKNRAQGPQHADSQTVCAGAQAAQVLAEQRRQHVQPPIHQVHCRAPSGCLAVQETSLRKEVQLWGFELSSANARLKV